MTNDQVLLFCLFGAVYALLLWCRFRYDLVAFAALAVAMVAGVVPVDGAVDGFGHPATIVVAFVLIASRGLSASGAVDLLSRYLVNARRSLSMHVGIMSAVAALLLQQAGYTVRRLH